MANNDMADTAFNEVTLRMNFIQFIYIHIEQYRKGESHAATVQLGRIQGFTRENSSFYATF